MRSLIPLLLVLNCPPGPPGPTSNPRVSVENTRLTPIDVYVSFGSDSQITQSDWAFCAGEKLSCSFSLEAQTAKPLPTSGKYLNATFSFEKPVGCQTTKAELNINNPTWYDILDISLVDGYNAKVGIETEDEAGGSLTLGPVLGPAGNDKAFGVFPYGCDICVARQDPPCGIDKGKDGCKTGSQYNPDVPCQYQAGTKGGGSAPIKIVLY